MYIEEIQICMQVISKLAISGDPLSTRAGCADESLQARAIKGKVCEDSRKTL